MNQDFSICLPVNNGLFNYRVAGIAFQAGRVLLHKSQSDRFWSLPGGRVQMLEFSGEALRREIMEELGCEIVIGSLVAIAENFFEYRHTVYHELGFYYRMDIHGIVDFSDRIVEEKGEELVFRWIPLEALDEKTIYPAIPLKSLLGENATVWHFRFEREILEAEN